MAGLFPKLHIDLDAVASNAAVMHQEMASRGIADCGVAKGADTANPVDNDYMRGGQSLNAD